MLEDLKEQVYRANLDLVEHGLVVLTWGNASGMDRDNGLVVIKPSGVDYASLQPADMVVVDLDGVVVEGKLRPSSDLPTHLVLYRAFEQSGGLTHTHSTHATMFAQAHSGVPCFGTTHADQFYGDVPVTRPMTREEVVSDYERHTGDVIVERFAELDPVAMPAALVAGHGPFTWGPDVDAAVKNAVALEQVARMALGTRQIRPDQGPIPAYLLDKHYLRKHGDDAYYGQQP